jgi:biotin synthesis protein BioG
MKSAWLHQRRNRWLIIFCNGWGMDANPFLPLGARDYDVLMLFDYSDLTLDCDPAPLFRHYQRTFLVSWSMGVWVGQQIFQSWSHRLQGAMAINGSLCPIHDQFGIPEQLYAATLEQFSAASRLKFYRRMCRERQAFNPVFENQPARYFDNQRLELEALHRQVSCQLAEEAIYTKVLIADQDLVVPTANQIAFWQGHKSVRLEGSHFLFYRWNTWDELMDMF